MIVEKLGKERGNEVEICRNFVERVTRGYHKQFLEDEYTAGKSHSVVMYEELKKLEDKNDERASKRAFGNV